MMELLTRLNKWFLYIRSLLTNRLFTPDEPAFIVDRLRFSRFILAVFYLHFGVFLLTLFDFPVVFHQALRISVTYSYMLICLIIYIWGHRRESALFYVVCVLVWGMLLLKFIILRSVPHFIPYAFFLVLIMRYIDLKEDSLLRMVNICFLVFFCLSMVFHFELIPSYYLVAFKGRMRILPNRLFPAAQRFLAMEGLSPAGIDSLGGMVAILNFYTFLGKRNIIYLCVAMLAVLIIIWTGSMTPIIALLLAGILIILPGRLMSVSVISISVIPFILLYFYRLREPIYVIYLDIITSLRIPIWDKMIDHFMSLGWGQKLLGPGESIEVFASGVYTTNPHSFIINTVFNYGLMFLAVIMGFLAVTANRIRSRNQRLVILYIYVASLSNNHLLDVYNPLMLFVFLYYLLNSSVYNSNNTAGPVLL